MAVVTQDQVVGIVRHALTFVGGIIVAKGLASDAYVQEIIGGAMTIIGVVWSIFSKKASTPSS